MLVWQVVMYNIQEYIINLIIREVLGAFKKLVINYREGELQNGKNCRSETFLGSPPPPFNMIKLQATAYFKCLPAIPVISDQSLQIKINLKAT